MDDYTCMDCGRDYLTIAAMLQCDCDRWDDRGMPVHVEGGDWIP